MAGRRLAPLTRGRGPLGRCLVAARHTHYKVLGVAPSATNDEIKDAYYRLAKDTHPDSAPEADEAAFRRLTQAYHTLSRAESRAAYDLQLRAGTVAQELDFAALDKRVAAHVAKQELAAALALFIARGHSDAPCVTPETGAMLLSACLKRAYMRPATMVFAKLRATSSLSAISCNEWFGACIAHGRVDEAMDVFRHMQVLGVEPSPATAATIRQAQAYRASTLSP